MISTPGSPNMVIAKYMVTLPPGTMTMRSGSISTPRYFRMSSATASRSGRMPFAGV